MTKRRLSSVGEILPARAAAIRSPHRMLSPSLSLLWHDDHIEHVSSGPAPLIIRCDMCVSLSHQIPRVSLAARGLSIFLSFLLAK